VAGGGLVELSYDARVEAEIRRGPRPEITYPGCLLCVGGVRRQREADSENDREPDPPHRHLGGGWLAGSLAERRDAHQHRAAHVRSPIHLTPANVTG
jgi:hypothetical protein